MNNSKLSMQLQKVREEERKYKEMFKYYCQNILSNYCMDKTVLMVSSITGRKYSGKIVLEETGVLPVPYYFCFHSYDRDSYGRVIFMEPWYMSEEDMNNGIQTWFENNILYNITVPRSNLDSTIDVPVQNE